MNRVMFATFAVGLVGGALAASVPPSGRISAAEVVARNVAARGGLEAWRRVETMAWRGRIESAHAPAPSMPFELEQKRPNKTRLQVDALGDRSVRAFDGVRGWKQRSGQGRSQAEPYTPQELASAQAGHGIDGPLLDAAARGLPVALEGVDEVGERRAYRLGVRSPQGGEEQVWVDAETFLDLRYDRTVDGPAGSTRRVSMTYGDYRTVEGLQLPFLITTGGGAGATPDRMRIETVVVNPRLEDSAFASPAASRQRHRGWPGVAAQAVAPAGPRAGPAAAGGPQGAAPR